MEPTDILSERNQRMNKQGPTLRFIDSASYENGGFTNEIKGHSTKMMGYISFQTRNGGF